MADDIVRELGLLTLGSRLRRIGERMQADVHRYLSREGAGVMPGQYPLLAALHRQGPLTISELVQALGTAQPGVTRSVGQLERLGLVEVRHGDRDRRTRTVALSPVGAQTIRTAWEDLWPSVGDAVAELCGEDGPRLLEQLDRIEAALSEQSLDARAAARLDERRRS